MTTLQQYMGNIHRDYVTEDQRVKQRVAKAYRNYGKMLENTQKQEVNELSKADKSKITNLLQKLVNQINKAVSQYVKTENPSMLSFDVTGIEQAYNDFVEYLNDIEFNTSYNFSEKNKVYSSVSEILPAVLTLRNRLTIDNDVSQNEKATLATIYVNLNTHNFNPIGAYTEIDAVTSRDKTAQKEAQKLATEQARNNQLDAERATQYAETKLRNDRLDLEQKTRDLEDAKHKQEQLQLFRNQFAQQNVQTKAQVQQINALDANIQKMAVEMAKQQTDLAEAQKKVEEAKQAMRAARNASVNVVTPAKVRPGVAPAAANPFTLQAEFDDAKNILEHGPITKQVRANKSGQIGPAAQARKDDKELAKRLIAQFMAYSQANDVPEMERTTLELQALASKYPIVSP